MHQGTIQWTSIWTILKSCDLRDAQYVTPVISSGIVQKQADLSTELPLSSSYASSD